MSTKPIVLWEGRDREYFRRFVSDDPLFLKFLDQILSGDPKGETHVVDRGEEAIALAELFLKEYPQLFPDLKQKHLEDYKKTLLREKTAPEIPAVPSGKSENKKMIGTSRLRFSEIGFDWEGVSPEPPDFFKQDIENVVRSAYRSSLTAVNKF